VPSGPATESQGRCTPPRHRGGGCRKPIRLKFGHSTRRPGDQHPPPGGRGGQNVNKVKRRSDPAATSPRIRVFSHPGALPVQNREPGGLEILRQALGAGAGRSRQAAESFRAGGPRLGRGDRSEKFALTTSKKQTAFTDHRLHRNFSRSRSPGGATRMTLIGAASPTTSASRWRSWGTEASGSG